MVAVVFCVTELKSEAGCDLGCGEAEVTQEAMKMNVLGNMHMDIRLIEDTNFKYGVKFNI